MIRRALTLATCLTAAAALAACTTTDPYTGEVVRDNTGTGAIVGAIGGGLLGYLTNTSDSEQGRKNALLGAGIGALGGAAVGNYMDRQQADLRRELADSGVTVTRDGDNLILNMPSDVTFASGSETLQPQFYDTLDDVGRVLQAYPSTLIDITGHADSDGADDYNLALSERRARSVADYLVQNSRLNPNRVALAGRGERDPVASNATAAGKARNRRVEILIRPLRG
jgi:outer membrane protein OmpA-like peptidoglycan-associated protein